MFVLFQGKKVFYHKVIIETPNNKELVSVKCLTAASYNFTKAPHSLVRRDVDLPLGFEEPMYVSIERFSTSHKFLVHLNREYLIFFKLFNLYAEFHIK